MNSIVPRDEDNWNDFNHMNDNNSFIIDNPVDEPKRDKEMIQDFEMMEQQPSPTTQSSVEETVATEFNVNEGSKTKESA